MIAQAPTTERDATILAMDIETVTPLLGGLSPRAFMKRHWQKKPLLVRGAASVVTLPTLGRARLFALAGRDDVQSRLVQRLGADWRLRHGPFMRRQLPPLARPGWTLLVQGVDLHDNAAHELLARFRFAPDARLDDLMLSYASDGGGVGPHADSYDVFLLQVHGQRRWRIGRLTDPALQPGAPLKLLRHFVAEQEWLLEAGDMLYLPPRWAHDGVAVGESITASIGFRAERRGELGVQVLQRMIDGVDDAAADDDSDAGQRDPLYRDPAQSATPNPALIPAPLAAFAADAVRRLLATPHGVDCALGEWLSEPKPSVWYDEPATLRRDAGMRLDRRTRMLYDARHLFVNGTSFRVGGRDATLLRRLADDRALDARSVAALSGPAWQLMQGWAGDGWLLPMVPVA